MKCREFQERLDDFLVAPSDEGARAEMDAHRKECPRCAGDYEAARQAAASIQLSHTLQASSLLKESIMSKIIETSRTESQNAGGRERGRMKIWKPLLAVAAVLAVVATVSLLNWFRQSNGLKPLSPFAPLSAFATLAQAEEAMAQIHSVHIKARMRTIANDNFELIGVNYDFVDHEIWREFTDPPKWRIEKSGRVVVMDGKEQVMLVKPDRAAKGPPGAGFVEWLKPLLDPQSLLESERKRAEKEGSAVSVKRVENPDGGNFIVLTVDAKAQGDFTNDWLKNKAISASDNYRIYVFDPETHLLKALQVYVRGEKQDTLVFETTKIEYDAPIDLALFTLVLPADVIWSQQSQVLPDNEKYAQMKPEEAARAFFQACADQNWEEALKFYPTSAIRQSMKDSLGGLEIISIGAPFKSGLYGGWFVPYEIKLKGGTTKKFNLAIRNDNPAKRWMVDGGL